MAGWVRGLQSFNATLKNERVHRMVYPTKDEAIDMAVRRCPIEKGVTIFHSDRGSQYTSQKFLEHLEAYGIRPSVGRTGA